MTWVIAAVTAGVYNAQRFGGTWAYYPAPVGPVDKVWHAFGYVRYLILHGEPDEIMRRPSNGQSNPWEAWKYTRPRPLKYVFYDQTRIGNYQLVYTDDRKEKGMPGWERLVGQGAVDEIARF